MKKKPIRRSGSPKPSASGGKLTEPKTALNVVFDDNHIEVMKRYANLKGVADRSRRLKAPQNDKAIASTFKSLVKSMGGTKRKERKNQYSGQCFRMYTTNELKRPSHRFRPYEEISAHSIGTIEEASKIVHSMAFRKLQGKMQLFPLHETPLLRTRLTHTLEVADVANRIALSLNERYFTNNDTKIDTSIVTAAALAHDLGHPPFGHTGELALASFMRDHGSFEGNAQTLRILTRLENRFIQKGRHIPDEVFRDPLGLNLLFRTLASVLKYDHMIAASNEGRSESAAETHKLSKGYYQEDRAVVDEIRAHLVRSAVKPKLKTIECQIMDLADDIAYSTYDLEDSMIAGITHPLDLLSIPDDVLALIAQKTSESMRNFGYNYDLNDEDISLVYMEIFQKLIIFNKDSAYNIKSSVDKARYISWTYANSVGISNSPLRRRALTESLINKAIQAVKIEAFDVAEPAMTKIALDPEILLQIEALKHFNYHNHIMSDRLQIYASRAAMIVTTLCDRLLLDTDNRMMSEADRYLYDFYGIEKDDNQRRRRYICDLIASMTDDEAIKMYERIATSNEMSVLGRI